MVENYYLCISKLKKKGDYNMKKIGNAYYAKVDVLHCGSFMIKSKIDMTDDDVITECENRDLIEEDDVDFASVDNLIDDYDLKHFKNCTYSI